MSQKKPILNHEDMTFDEWRKATYWENTTGKEHRALKSAWAKGVDPTEYRANQEEIRNKINGV